MTFLRLTDITIRVPSGLQQQHDAFTDESSLFLEVKIENEVQRMGPLIRESSLSWKAPEDIVMPANTPVIKITIVLQCDAQPGTEIGSVEIISVSQCIEHVDESTQTITGVGNIPNLELSYSCSAIPPVESHDDVPRPSMEAILNEIIGQDPDHAFAILERGFDDAVLLPDEDEKKPAVFAWAAHWLGAVYLKSKREAHLNKAITALDVAMEFMPEEHPSHSTNLSWLGLLLSIRAKRSSDLADINRAISTLEWTTSVKTEVDMDIVSLRARLGDMLLLRFERFGEVTDLDMCISVYRDVVHLTPDGHDGKLAYLNNLGYSLYSRFERTGKVVDIDEAISVHKHALRLTPDGHTNQPMYLNNLGRSFRNRFEHRGELADIEEAISAHKHAVFLTPKGHVDRLIYLNNLGNSFQTRFERTGELADIEEAISTHKHAVSLTPEGHADKPMYFNGLGNSFLTRFESTGVLADVEEAISTHKHAVSLIPEGHVNRPTYLNSLGNSFLDRFERTGELADIGEAISAHKHACSLTPEGHADKPVYSNNLGNSLLRRFEHRGELADIDEAISAYRRAVRLSPEGHVDKPGRHSNLGKSFQHRFNRSHEDADLDRALEQFLFLHLVFRFTFIDAYSVAISLLPRLAWLGQTVSKRYKALASVGDIGNEAAAAAIQLGRFDLALEWLEASRSVVWGQLLHLRTPVDKLRNIQPELADELVLISRELDRAGTRDFHSNPSNKQPPESMEQAALRHYRLAERWDSLVEQVRAVPGFGDFLRPKKLPQLIEAAQSGPVITINVHQSRCDCLALIPGHDDVIHIPLDHFSYEQALKLKRLLDQSLSASGIRMRDIRGHDFVPRSGAGVVGILSTLWYTVVKPVLDSLAFGVSNVEDPPRIWWCPTGPLSFLPIHAAGICATTTLGFKVTDFVTSSYTPTLTTLIERSRNTRTSFEGLLAIGQPNTPGQSRLPNALKELSDIQLLGSSDFHIHNLLGEQATIEEVAKGMGERSWVHLACHATQDVLEPTQSAFHLHDGRLTLSRIISNSFPHADFAFLSACQTAKGDDKLPEEAVHLAGGMIAAGYRSVIATTWSIKDQHAPLVADEVYRRLDCGPSPDSRRAAHALHHAVKKLREKLGNDSETSLLSWVPFIHVGI